jgi:hypothetical protein
VLDGFLRSLARSPSKYLNANEKEKKVVNVARLDLLILHQPTDCRKNLLFGDASNIELISNN